MFVKKTHNIPCCRRRSRRLYRSTDQNTAAPRNSCHV